MVGTVDDMSDSNDGLSYLLKIKLATDFGKLSDVRVVARTGQEEQKKLENKVMKEWLLLIYIESDGLSAWYFFRC